jgi:mono/diheme cytochrome c family protein
MSRFSRFVTAMLVFGLWLAGCGQTPTPTATPQLPTTTPIPPTITSPLPTAASLPTDTLLPRTATPMPPTATSAPPTATTVPTVPPTAVPPTPTSLPTATPLPTAVPTKTTPPVPDAALGAQLWPQQPCAVCHGAAAQGDFGPKLVGTGLSIAQVLSQVRLGKGAMPAFGEEQISDTVLRHIYAWLRSLAPPTPTPISRPSFPTQALTEMWYSVNEMRIRADFAKDLPVRVANDDAGRLKVVKDYSGDGLNQAQQVLARANQALNEVPMEGVKAIIREVIRETNLVVERFNAALAQGSYDAAWQQVAEAVSICRLDTLPWATQAVRDAGLVGTVRVRVVDQAGRALVGALATVLTAHTPLGGVTDANGRVTFVNVAAVPALPVKAYTAGRVYHEINANVSPGGTMDGTITLPSLPGRTVAPEVKDASIQPASGAGDATVTFAVTATDPQGRLDLAEDQIFALNPELGLAYVLLHGAGDRYQVQVKLPNLAAGLHTWHFFAVDHECNTSSIIELRYRVQ